MRGLTLNEISPLYSYPGQDVLLAKRSAVFFCLISFSRERESSFTVWHARTMLEPKKDAIFKIARLLLRHSPIIRRAGPGRPPIGNRSNGENPLKTDSSRSCQALCKFIWSLPEGDFLYRRVLAKRSPCQDSLFLEGSWLISWLTFQRKLSLDSKRCFRITNFLVRLKPTFLKLFNPSSNKLFGPYLSMWTEPNKSVEQERRKGFVCIENLFNASLRLKISLSWEVAVGFCTLHKRNNARSRLHSSTTLEKLQCASLRKWLA